MTYGFSVNGNEKGPEVRQRRTFQEKRLRRRS